MPSRVMEGRAVPMRATNVWAMDFVRYQLYGGRRIFGRLPLCCLTVRIFA